MPKKKPSVRNPRKVKKASPTKERKSFKSVNPSKIIRSLEEQQKRFFRALAAARIGLWEWDIKSEAVEWTDRAHEIFGIAKKDFHGTYAAYMERIHPDDKNKVVTAIRDALESRNPYTIEHRIILPDGIIRWVECTGRPVKDRLGKLIKLTGTIQDVTEKKSIEQEREDWKIRHELISSSAGIVIYDYNIASGDIIWSGNCEEILGYAPNELGNIERWEQLIHPDDRVAASIQLDHALKLLKTYDVSYRFMMKNGQYCYVHDRGFFTPDDQGNAQRMLGMMNDVSAQMQAIDAMHKSEKSYRELFDTVGEAIYIQDLDGNFLDVNRFAYTMYGYEKQEIIGKNPAFLAAEGKNDFEVVKNKIQKAIEGEPQSFEFWGKKRTGEIFLKEVRVTKGTYFGKDAIIATAWDVTERRKTEQALRESEQRFRLLQEASFAGIGIHDDGIIMDCNQGLCNITGYRYEELIGMNGLILIAPEWRDLVRHNITTRYDKPYDVEGVRKDGSRYFLEIKGKNIPYHGKSIRVTEFQDITERKQVEERILEQNNRLITVSEDLRRKNNQLKEFTQIVSHNLRSPVGNIVSLVDFFRNASTPEEREEYFNHLKNATDTTLSMLNEINEVLQIKQDKHIEKQELEFERVFHAVKNMLHASANELDAEITCDFTAAPKIYYANIYLESIFLNLLSNSLKYHHPDRKTKIHFRTYLKENQIIMEARDNGLGINLEKYGHQIFKLRKTFHRHPESKGIGLFMIKNQIEAMGGEISLSSVENEGTVFTINFNKQQFDAA